MLLHILAGRESLTDIRHVAHDGTQAAALTGGQLCPDVLERGRLGGLPLHTGAKLYTKPTGHAYPVGLAKNTLRLALIQL